MADKEDAFANNLHALRLVRGLSQAELARQVGVRAASVVNWEHGMNMPSLRTSVRLAEVLGCTLDELTGKPLALTASAPEE